MSFGGVAISPDGQVVGWLAMYPNCCTSYPIPLALVLYSQGRTRTLTRSGLPISDWAFQAGGTRVAFHQETVHGGIAVHYELRAVATGRLIAEYDPPPDTDLEPRPNDEPDWVRELNAAAR